MLVLLLNDLPAAASLGAGGGVIGSATLNTPVEDIVVLVAFTDEQVPEELAEVRVIGLVVEAESTSVVEEDAELGGETTAKDIGWSGHLLLHDAVVLLLLGSSLQSLPGESAAEEVHEDVGQRLEVVTTGLFNAQMGVDGRVPGSTGKVLILPVRDMKVRLGVPELLGETEVDDVDLVATLPDAHQEVVGLDVTVDEVARVDVLDAGDLKTG